MKELWNSEKGKAGITLTLWLIFIAFVIGLVSFGGKNQNVSIEKKIDDVNIQDKINSLFDSDRSFKMTVETNDLESKRVYDISYLNGIYEGYIEDESGINKIKCDTKCYKVYLDHEEEDSIYDEEFISALNYLKSNSFSLKKDNDNIYSAINDNNVIKIVLENNDIIKIVIESETNKIIIDLNNKSA